jgi:hypothetical protein
MRITDESEEDRLGNAEIVVRVDPHDGTCRGAHDIIIAAFRLPDGMATEHRMHVTLSWGTNALLSIRGSEEFVEALEVALGIARQIRADGTYNAALVRLDGEAEPDMTISKVP